MTKAPRRKPHWAACRHPDIRHAGRKFWRVPHHRERILVQFWYSELGPLGGSDEFDVRDLPVWKEVGPFPWNAGGLVAAATKHIAEQQAVNAVVIRSCVDSGLDIQALFRAAQAIRDGEWKRWREMPRTATVDEIPF